MSRDDDRYDDQPSRPTPASAVRSAIAPVVPKPVPVPRWKSEGPVLPDEQDRAAGLMGLRAARAALADAAPPAPEFVSGAAGVVHDVAESARAARAAAEVSEEINA